MAADKTRRIPATLKVEVVGEFITVVVRYTPSNKALAALKNLQFPACRWTFRL
jgi:hypothetical protein